MSLLNIIRRFTVALRAIPGGLLVGEYARKLVARKRKTLMVNNVDGDIAMLLDLDEHMQGQIFWHGSYSREIIFLLKRILRPGMTVVDGGANIGELSLISAKLVGPHGRVLSFEPINRFADRLEQNVHANRYSWVDLHRSGLGERSGEALIYTADAAYADGTHNDGLGTLFPGAGRNHPEQAIQIETLDEVLERQGLSPDLIKLDIEGAELPALKGAYRTLSERRPDLIVEIGEATCQAAGYHGVDILNFLGPLGYSFFKIGRKGKLTALTSAALTDFQNIFCTQANTVGR